MASGKELFGRKWEVQITDPKSGESKTWGLDDGLRVQFAIKEGDNTANNTEIELTITNLSKKNREWVLKENNLILLKAGYINNYGEIFTGKVVYGSNLHDDHRAFSHQANKRDDTDWSTQVNGIDGSLTKKKSVINISLSEKTTLQTVLNKVSDELGLKKNIKLPKGLKKDKFYNGFSTLGSHDKILDKLAKDYGLTWYVKNNTLNMYSPNTGLNNEVYSFDAESGLVGSVEKTEKGYKFKTLLIPSLYKGQYINLKTRTINGFFVISKIGYIGDSSGQEWYTEFEVIAKK